MKTLRFILVLIPLALFWAACSDDGPSERFRLLTGNVWLSDSLLINNMDASMPGGLLESFKGEAIFRKDGTGSFGSFEGIWSFAKNETELIISSDSLAVPLPTRILELTDQDLKVSTSLPDFDNLTNPPLQIRLTFKAKQ